MTDAITTTFTVITYFILTCTCGVRAHGSVSEAVTVVSGYYLNRPFSRRTSKVVSDSCPKTCGCGRVFARRAVKATRNDAVKCDARCTGAKGHVCECSCSGANHGTAA